MTLLADSAPVVSVDEHADGGMCVVVVLTFDAETLRDAVLVSLRLVEDAVGESASGLEVLPSWVYDQRAEQRCKVPEPP